MNLSTLASKATDLPIKWDLAAFTTGDSFDAVAFASNMGITNTLGAMSVDPAQPVQSQGIGTGQGRGTGREA